VIVRFVDVGKTVDHQMFKLSLHKVAQYHDTLIQFIILLLTVKAG